MNLLAQNHRNSTRGFRAKACPRSASEAHTRPLWNWIVVDTTPTAAGFPSLVTIDKRCKATCGPDVNKIGCRESNKGVLPLSAGAGVTHLLYSGT